MRRRSEPVYAETLAGIRARAAKIPDPPPALRTRVEAELDQARRRATSILPGKTTPTGRTYRRRDGLCSGCGGDLDDATDGCPNCQARHYMRARSARLRLLTAAV